jgi:Asp-tRNA(Asn)/Glu-tRNA(Gln) amidotransferase A subunit family amidase
MGLLSARKRAARTGVIALALAALSAPSAGAATPDLGNVTIAELERALVRGKVSCREVVRDGLARIAAHDGTVNAVVTVNPHARAEAARLDRRRAAGRRVGDAHCLPVIVKDNIETLHVRTTFGSSLFADWVPARDAPVVAQLRDEGAIVLAKGNLDDFAAAVYGVSEIDGWMRNPYDPSRTVGGSSGGPAAAVTAGYAPLGIGTDTGGSLRIPAAFNGVVTIRPTIGLVSRKGMSPRALTQDTAGPLARNVADAAAGLDLIDDHRVPFASYARGGRLGGVRIGVIREGIPLWGGIQPGVAALEERALDDLEALGATVVALPQDFVDRLDRGFDCGDCLLDSGVIGFESRRDLTAYLAGARPAPPVRSFDDLYASGRYSAHAKEAFDREAGVDLADPATAAAYRTARDRQEALRQATLRMLGDLGLDAVAYPSATWFLDPLGVEQSGVFTRWSEHTGFPALGVPIGLGPLPASLELLGRPYSEPELIRIAAAYERATQPRVPPPAAR